MIGLIFANQLLLRLIWGGQSVHHWHSGGARERLRRCIVVNFILNSAVPSMPRLSVIHLAKSCIHEKGTIFALKSLMNP
jgi:hypothetical protein